MAGKLSLAVLGPLRVTRAGAPVTGFTYHKVPALLVYLAVEADRPHAREALVGLLWPDQPEAAARTSLRQALARLREALGADQAAPPFLLATRDTVQFNPASDFDLDLNTFGELLDQCAIHPHRGLDRCPSCAARLAEAARLYRGGFLAEFSRAGSAPFEEWAIIKREQLHRRAQAALGALAAHHERRGSFDHAQHLARRLIELDPWNEDAYRQLMRAHARSGQRSAALAVYEDCRRALQAGLGAPPATETQALHAQILSGQFGPAPAPAALKGHWPASLTPLVGRQAQLQALAGHLANPDCRLLTLAGPGGIGKTRLALAAAAEHAWAFDDGAAHVPLTSLNAPGHLTAALAQTLGVALSGPGEPREQLVSALRDREILIVLDGFEHLLAEGASAAVALDWLADLLARCPRVCLLITSRERAGLPGEWLFSVPGLPYPAAEDDGAVRLFVQCAARIRPGFAPAVDDWASIARICRLVEGLPLAIELAAAWVRVLGCDAIAGEIERGIGVLAASRQEVAERHRSMRAVLEQSWQLLAPELRLPFQRLAVFHGGFEREAAQAVAGLSLPLLSALVDKSLVQQPGPERYDLHALSRQFAREKLAAAGEESETCARHAHYFLQLAERAEPALRGPEQPAWLARLDAEHDNLRAALAWCLQQNTSPAIELGLRLASALGGFWWVRGQSEGRDWLRALLQQDAARPTVARAHALALAADLALEQEGRHPAARAMYAESLHICQQAGHEPGVATALLGLGGIARAEGDADGAQALYLESLSLWRQTGEQWGTAWALHRLGQLAFAQGQLQAARTAFHECLAIRRALGDRSGQAWVHNILGEVARFEGDFEQAESLYQESLRLHEALGDKAGAAATLSNLGYIALNQGNPRLARTRFTASLAQNPANKGLAALCLIGLAGLARPPERAARLLGAAEPYRHQVSSPADRADHDRIFAAVRTQLAAATFAACWEAGQKMVLDEALALARDRASRGNPGASAVSRPD
jgi:predicted ATPase/Tfp pilus assembly protein PilF